LEAGRLIIGNIRPFGAAGSGVASAGMRDGPAYVELVIEEVGPDGFTGSWRGVAGGARWVGTPHGRFCAVRAADTSTDSAAVQH
jgi:hypothetical protein